MQYFVFFGKIIVKSEHIDIQQRFHILSQENYILSKHSFQT